MKKTVLFVVMMLLVSTYCLAADLGSDWIKFTAPDKSYAVMFPGQPNTTVDNAQHTRTVLTSFFWEKRLAFISGYTDYDVIPDIQSELIANQTNFLAETKASLTSSKQFEFERAPNDNLPALVFTGSGNGRNFKGIVIVDRPRTYIFVVGETGNSISNNTLRFLDSARLYKVAK